MMDLAHIPKTPTTKPRPEIPCEICENGENGKKCCPLRFKWKSCPSGIPMPLPTNPPAAAKPTPPPPTKYPRADIQDPQISVWYDKFRKWKRIPYGCPFSDDERAEFDRLAYEKLQRLKAQHLEKEKTPCPPVQR